MNTKALITALAIVIGSSSVAMARPATVSVSGSVRGSISFGTNHNNQSNYRTPYQQPDIRDHRTPVRTVIRQPVAQTWGGWNHEPVIMDRNLQFSTPGADGEMPYNDARWESVGTFGTGDYGTSALVYNRETAYAIKLEAMSGRPAFTSLLITYQDGSRQEVQVNAFVSRAGITIPTKAAAIRQVQFLSPSNVRGTFSFSIAHGI